MINSTPPRSVRPRLVVGALILAFGILLNGCGRGDIQVYRVAKADAQSKPAPAQSSGGLPTGHPDISQAGAAPLKWTTPSDWEEVPPGEMRIASFHVKGKDAKQADVSIVPLPGNAGGDLANVNRWRTTVGQTAITQDDLGKVGQPVAIAGKDALLYDIAGKNPSSDDKVRILAAIQRRDGTSWFFKMVGDDQLVADQKPTFIEFLRSLTFASTSGGSVASELPPTHPPIDTSAAAPLPSVAGGASDDGKPKWQVPAGWKELAGGQFLAGKFLISGPDNSQASVNVGTSGGGVPANVNRWRGQIGLPGLSDAELEKQMQTLEVTGAKAMLIDMTGTDARTSKSARIIGAIVQEANGTWFYKLMGDPQLVAQQKDVFTRFVQTAIYK